MEISKLTQKYDRLHQDYTATRELLSELEDVLARTENKQMVDLASLIKNEVIHFKMIRENYEHSLIQEQHANALY